MVFMIETVLCLYVCLVSFVLFTMGMEGAKTSHMYLLKATFDEVLSGRLLYFSKCQVLLTYFF